ncbi:hypothetical protein BN1723_004863 [Verticillium longisporum]|uniref:alpha-galactosidase n=1 Tax=Verticillium longisporum TaxID=100787 RepID=A0A0G4N2M3_VERLO|nr:hypothetical protein BN1723_004863 [Verticillium longisporum]
MGIKPPKGVILYGAPGTGKTLLAKAVANQTSATFLRIVGSELIQKYLGDGPRLVRQLFQISGFQKKGSWADMDMLEVGVNRNFTLHQDQTHLSFWAALKSPLIIGADITTIRRSSLDVLLQKEIIGINQDDLGVAVSYVAELSKEDEIQVWAGPVKYKRYNHVALALNYNVVSHTADIELPWSKLPGFQGCKNGNVRVRDVWEDKDLVSGKESITLQEVAQDQTKVLLLSC